MAQRTVMLVDDDVDFQATFAASFAALGTFTVESAASGEAALRDLLPNPPDVLLVDLGLPSISGLELIRRVRETDQQLPILVLSARDDEGNRVVALNLGADDYVTKPFSFLELVARMNALLRRAQPSQDAPALDFGDLRIDLQAREVTVDGALVALTAKEFDLLTCLATSPRRVFTVNQLLLLVWGAQPGWQSPATVKEHIRRVRSKIETSPGSHRHVVTVQRMGYRFDPA